MSSRLQPAVVFYPDLWPIEKLDVGGRFTIPDQGDAKLYIVTAVDRDKVFYREHQPKSPDLECSYGLKVYPILSMTTVQIIWD